jgi:hypothetical protein
VCDHIPAIPLPFLKWFKHVDDDGTVYLFDEWYGGDLHSQFCAYIHMPLANEMLRREKCIYQVNIGWDKGKELFYNDNPEMWDEEENEYGKDA